MEDYMVRTWFVSVITPVAILQTRGPNLDSERDAANRRASGWCERTRT